MSYNNSSTIQEKNSVTLDHLVNDKIRTREVRLIDESGEQLGIFSTYDAMNRARVAGLDLVAISPNANPPVCKILDYGKFKYEQTKRDKEQAKRSRASQTETKEIQLRPVTDTHDLVIKAKRAQEFLSEGDKVKVVVKFKGREVSHADMGRKVLESFLANLGEHKVERAITLSGKDMTAVVAPAVKKST